MSSHHAAKPHEVHSFTLFCKHERQPCLEYSWVLKSLKWYFSTPQLYLFIFHSFFFFLQFATHAHEMSETHVNFTGCCTDWVCVVTRKICIAIVVIERKGILTLIQLVQPTTLVAHKNWRLKKFTVGGLHFFPSND